MVSLRFVVTGAVALMAVTTNAALSAEQIVAGLNAITQRAQALQPIAQSINVINAPLVFAGRGPYPALLSGFAEIVHLENTLISNIVGSKPIQRRGGATIADVAKRGPEADAVYGSYRAMHRVFQTLLSTLIDKAAKNPEIVLHVGAPIAAVLRSLEADTDAISNSLIGLVQSRAPALEFEAKQFGSTLETAVKTYSGAQL